MVYCRPFAWKAPFWTILKDFEFAVHRFLKLKILQIRSKNRFWCKRTTTYYRLANLTLIYIAIGQANGKSNTFTIKWQSITHTDFVGLLCTPTKHSKEYPPRGGGVNVSMIMNNYIHTWFIWLAGQKWQLIQLMWTNMINKLKYKIINN